MNLVTIIVLALVTYRVTRFFLDDSMLELTRLRLKGWLTRRRNVLLRVKAVELMSCPYCFSVWVSAGAVIFLNQFQPVVQPVLTWLAVAGLTMVVWRIVED